MRNRFDKTLATLQKHASPAKVAEYKRKRGLDRKIDHRPGVLSCLWNTTTVFLMLSNQWARVGMIGAFTRIPSEAIESTLRLSGRSLTPQEYEDLQLMEAVAKPLLNQALSDT